ncbi:MAG: hypothetical protein COU25_02675 [Candidatus Levybacteria bacterium CG10_big_fil_rev_8_21_14_0_10_35_13]|nr:MAG: hypothetical protein COU25_02675 [Candidatus Levybacteria bacterium CG10_big_fil_rev_8_21_14_0_10_35_13]
MDNFTKLLNKSFRFLSYRPRSEKEVVEYLKKKISNFQFPISNFKTAEEIIDSIIEKLKEQKFIDDTEFAKWWIEQRSKVKPKAIKFIIFELKQKGIAKELIDEILNDKEFEVISDFDKALELAKKRIKRYEKEEPKKAYEKMVRFLASKGFEWEIIKKVIDQTFPKRYNT